MTQDSPMFDADAVKNTLQTWPHPLPGILLRYWKSREPDDDGNPSQPPSNYAIVDLAGNVLRFLATVQLSHHLQWRHVKQNRQQVDADRNRLILTTVSTGSDGNWLKLLIEIDTSMSRADEHGELIHSFPVRSLLRGHRTVCCPRDEKLPTICSAPRFSRQDEAVGLTRYQVLGVLNEYRNKIIHGAEPNEEDRFRAAAILERLLVSLSDLSQLRVAVVDSHGRCLLCQGLVLDAFPEERGIGTGEEQAYRPFLLGSDGVPRTSLWPFLLYVDEEVAPQMRLNEFCFFSQAEAQAVHYSLFLRTGRVSSRELGEIGDLSYRDYAELMSWVSQHASPEGSLPDTFDDNAFTEQLCSSFVGRRNEFDRLQTWIRNTGSGFGAVTGGAGSGKSALLAQLRAIVRLGKAATTGAGTAGMARFAWHFCARREGRDDILRILRSLCRQIVDGVPEVFPDPQPLPETLGELKARLEGLIHRVAEFSQTTDRPIKLVIVVDALDEASAFRGGSDVVLAALPESLPPGVLVLCSYRVEEDGTPTVEIGERKLQLEPVLSEPLRPLDLGAVRELLQKTFAGSDREFHEEHAEAIHRASGGDPLYLFFLAQSLRTGEVNLDELDAVPRGIGAFFRHELWNCLPVDNDYAAYRLLLLLGCARASWTDRQVATYLGLSHSDVVFARAGLGRFLKYGRDDLGETTFELFHERLREYVQSEFSVEELLRQHRDLIEHFSPPGFEDAADSPGWHHLSFHRFEHGRLSGDFGLLFAAADSGFVDRKFATLADPSSVAEDYSLVLRACLLAGELERAFRTALDRSVISSEVRWLKERGLPRLLARVAPAVGPSQLRTLAGACDLIKDDSDRLEAQLEIAEGCLGQVPDAAVEAMVNNVLVAIVNLPPSTAVVGILAQAVPLVWSHFPESRPKLLSALTVWEKSLRDVAKALKGSVLDWIDQDFVEQAVPVFLGGAEKASELSGTKETVDVDPSLGQVLDIEDRYSTVDRGRVMRDAVPQTLSAFLEPFVWCDWSRLDAGVLDAFERTARERDVPAPDLHAVRARLAARRGDWDGVTRVFREAIADVNRWSSTGVLGRLGLVVREIDVPGTPCHGAAEDERLSFLVADELFSEARKQIPREAFQTDRRGKRATEVVLTFDFADTDTPAGITATSAAGHLAMGAADQARHEFEAAVEELHKAQLPSWKGDLEILVHAALRFPDDREKLARLFDLIRVIETTVSGLLEMSQKYVVSVVVEAMKAVLRKLDNHHMEIALRRLRDMVDVFSSNEARSRLLLWLGEASWQRGHRSEAVDCLADACRGLAFQDRTAYGAEGFRAAAELAPFVGPETQHALAETIVRLARTGVAYGENLSLLLPLFDVLRELDEESARRLFDEARELVRQTSAEQLPGSVVERMFEAAARFGPELPRELLQHWYDRYAAADHRERRFWLLTLVPLAIARDPRGIGERLRADVIEIKDLADRNDRCCRYAEAWLRAVPGDPGPVHSLLATARPKEGDLEAMRRRKLEELSQQTGIFVEQVGQFFEKAGRKANFWDPLEGLQGSIESAAINVIVSRMLGNRVDFSRDYFEALARTARVAACAGDGGQTAELLRRLVAETGDRPGGEWFEELAETAAIVAPSARPVSEALVELLEVGVIDMDQPDWVVNGARVARAMVAVGRHSDARQLIEDRVRMAEQSAAAFPHSAVSDLIAVLQQMGPDWNSRVDRLFAAITRWDEQAIAKPGPSAAGAIRFDVDRALLLTRRSDESSRVATYLALARTLAECPPGWTDYAAYRLVESAADLPNDLLLALMTSLCVHLSNNPATAPVPRDRLSALVMGEEGNGLFSGTATTISETN